MKGLAQRAGARWRSIAIIVVLLVLTAGGCWWYASRQSQSQPVDQAPAQPNTPAEQQPSATKQPVTVNLPNATPIPARISDYTADADLWKLVNKNTGYTTPTYAPNDLTLVTVPTMPGRGQDERSMRQIVMNDLSAMFAAAHTAGIDLHAGSGYRSYDTQSALFSRYSQQYGEAAASRFSARPGHSEHQSGLAVDLVGADGNCWVDECFKDTAAGIWLAKHAHEYGFILRYPEGKEDVTGLMYESWHFRYVGRELAGALRQSGLTLDEAWPYLEKAMTELKNRGEL